MTKADYKYQDYFPKDTAIRINDSAYKSQVAETLNSIKDPIQLQETIAAYKELLPKVNKLHFCSSQGCRYAKNPLESKQ